MTAGGAIGWGPRLLLRVLKSGDAPAIHALNDDPEVVRYTGDVAFLDVAEAEAVVAAQRVRQERDGFSRWAVIERDAGDGAPLVGWCGLKRHDDGAVDLGYRFFRRVWSRGYATEAACIAMAFAFDVARLDTLVAHAMAENVASLRVLEKLGFTRQGTAACGGVQAPFYVMSRAGYEAGERLASVRLAADDPFPHPSGS